MRVLLRDVSDMDAWCTLPARSHLSSTAAGWNIVLMIRLIELPRSYAGERVSARMRFDRFHSRAMQPSQSGNDRDVARPV
ncbi:MAG: hypothetical protein JWO52_6640 [Gammaproteobacteria bacterium]|nr:hypothetical protein [Gammaproteobacteria bacterium]